MPQTKPQQVTEEQAASPTEGTDEEIHAAIQELSRLMGVPFPNPTGYQVPLGYAVYTYPSPTPHPTPQVPQPEVAGSTLSNLPSWPNGQGVLMTSASPGQSFGLDQFGGLPVTSGYSAWGPVLVAGCFR